MKSIPCTYKGVKMRSRLEATWAAVLDNYGIEWVYEPEGYELSDGTLYLPDFYLPRANMIFEVKGVMTFKDALKYASEFDINLIPYENYKDMTETKKAVQKIGKNQKIGIFIGPEGGFDESEVEIASDLGVNKISLGKRILRTETAGLMIISVIMFSLEE